MHPLIIVGIVLGVLLLISLIPIGCKVTYLSDKLEVRAKLGLIWILVFPQKEKKKKPKSAKPKDKPEKKGGITRPESKLELAQDLLPIVVDGAGSLQKKLSIDRLDLLFIMGGSDPANVAIGFGVANGILGGFIALLEEGFTIKDRHISTQLSFERTTPLIEGTLALSLTVGQILYLVIRIGRQLLQQLRVWKESENMTQD